MRGKLSWQGGLVELQNAAGVCYAAERMYLTI